MSCAHFSMAGNTHPICLRGDLTVVQSCPGDQQHGENVAILYACSCRPEADVVLYRVKWWSKSGGEGVKSCWRPVTSSPALS